MYQRTYCIHGSRVLIETQIHGHILGGSSRLIGKGFCGTNEVQFNSWGSCVDDEDNSLDGMWIGHHRIVAAVGGEYAV